MCVSVSARMRAHTCAQELRARASHPRAHAHMDAPARTWSHAKPCTHDCSDQTQLESPRFIVAPLQRRQTVALQRWTVAWCPPHAAWRMRAAARNSCVLRSRVADLRLGCRRGGRRSRRRRCRRRGRCRRVGRPGRRRPGHLHPARHGFPARRGIPARYCVAPCLESCATSGGLVDAGCAR